MYKFHLKFRPTSREPMIWAIMSALGLSFVDARDVLDNGLVVSDGLLGSLVSTLDGSITGENMARRLVKHREQPNVPYTPFTCNYDLKSYDYRPAINREPVVIKELIEA